MEPFETPGRGPTIYDVARRAGVSIASVSRVLNGSGKPRPDTRERVLAAVGELGFVPDGAARALSSRLKEVVGVVLRAPEHDPLRAPDSLDAEDSLLFADVINRGVETAAWARGYDLLLSSAPPTGEGRLSRIASVAGKSDGLILHDQVLDADGVAQVARRTPVVTLAGAPAPGSVNVRGDNAGGMRALVRHLAGDHGYASLGYLAGDTDSPDNLARQRVFGQEVERLGVTGLTGPAWQGNYTAAGGARTVRRLAEAGALPRAIVCASDQTALGVLRGLAGLGIAVPERVAVTGFDDIPVGRHLSPTLTTVRQPIQRLGATAFEVLYGMINGEGRPGPEVVLPVQLVLRASCGCPPE